MTVIGVLGGWRRDHVTPWGGIDPGDGSARLDWMVAAEDRWYRPEAESSVRQRCVSGTPVVETRLHVPGGDVVHRVTALPDHGGVTVVEVANESPLPVAVAFTRPDLWLVRPPTAVPTPGVDLPPDSVVVPLGHRASVRAALAHDRPTAALLPSDLPDMDAVVRSWLAACARAGRVEIPERTAWEAWIQSRCQAALRFEGEPSRSELADDSVGWLLRCHEAVRLGEPAQHWLVDVAAAVEVLVRGPRRFGRGARSTRNLDTLTWERWRALLAAEAVTGVSGDSTAAGDASALLGRVRSVGEAPIEAPPQVSGAAWFEDRLVRPRPDGAVELFPGGLPMAWFGASLEVHDLEVARGRRLSFAIRWHGERPALLWEWTMPPGSATPALVGGGLDPNWSSLEESGEALLGIPPGAPASVVMPSDLTSFS
jgi:hypothetical protein